MRLTALPLWVGAVGLPMLPYELRDEFVKGNLVLFIGAGFVRNYINGMPLWSDLLKKVFASLSGPPDEIFKYCDYVNAEAGWPDEKAGRGSLFVRSRDLTQGTSSPGETTATDTLARRARTAHHSNSTDWVLASIFGLRKNA